MSTTLREAIEATAEIGRKLFGRSVRERQIEAARARGDEWMIPMLQACDDGFVQDVVRDHRNEPRGPSQAGTSGQVTKVSSNAGLPGSNTGWRAPTSIDRPQPGINYVDAQLDAQDARDRAELIRREQAVRRAKGG